jgi:hypothetical protein
MQHERWGRRTPNPGEILRTESLFANKDSAALFLTGEWAED